MKTPKRIKQLEKMATNMVGDGKNPNLFFVSIQGVIVTVTRNFGNACNQWKGLSLAKVESMLEDRKWGTICEALKDQGGLLMVIDNSKEFKKQYLKPERNARQ